MKMYWTFIAVLVFHVVVRSTSAQSPSQREDVMGKYFVMSRYQCELLCWYRKLCRTYSYMYDSVQALDGNCVLHAANITTNTTNMVPTGWIKRDAISSPTTQSSACHSRPCEETEMCSPTYKSPSYTCHLVAAECQAPSRDDGVYSNVTLVQGQRTEFTCSPSLVWAPRHADKTVTCQVNGKYSGLKGTCKNATYYSPDTPFNAPFPDVVTEEWGACIKGIFTPINDGRMTFNFHDVQTASCDYSANGGNVYLQLDFRYSYSKHYREMWWFRGMNNCQWQIPTSALGSLPLNPNDYFEITLSILFNNTLQIIFKNVTTMQINLESNNINMTGATYLEILRGVRLSYVNLGKGCE